MFNDNKVIIIITNYLYYIVQHEIAQVTFYYYD